MNNTAIKTHCYTTVYEKGPYEENICFLKKKYTFSKNICFLERIYLRKNIYFS